MKKTIITLLLLALALSAAAQKIDPKKVYQILTPDGLAIDNQASLSIETHMFLAVPDNDSPAQAWQFRPLGDGNYHCFNVVGGCVFDLTSEQFGDKVLDYSNAVPQQRATHFAKEEKHRRYLLLLSRLVQVENV